MRGFVLALGVLLASVSFAQEGRCDPHGVDLPEFVVLSVPIEHELFLDEARVSRQPVARSSALTSRPSWSTASERPCTPAMASANR